MNVSSTKSPYLLQIERSSKPKATFGNRFRIALKTEKAESQAKDADTEGLESEETMQSNSTPPYVTLTNEMEQLFRGMFGRDPYEPEDPDETASMALEETELASRKNELFFKVSADLDPNVPVVDFFDFLMEQGGFSSKEEVMAYLRGEKSANDGFIEIDGEMVDISTIDKISFEGLEWYTPEFDPLVEWGMDYMESCFDFSHSGDYSKLTAAEDFTGMTDAEKYKAIYEKYQHCYGENFYYSKAISYPMAPSEYDSYRPILRRFEKEVAAVCDNVEKARREALYESTRSDEVRQEIIDSYDLEDGMTFRELYQMTYDMWKVGLDGGLHNRLDLLFYDLTTTANSHMLTREPVLDTDVSWKDLSELQKFYDSAMYCGNSILPAYQSALSQIRAAYGAGGSGGVPASSLLSESEDNFKWIKL